MAQERSARTHQAVGRRGTERLIDMPVQGQGIEMQSE
jgi:hypothetical protein